MMKLTISIIAIFSMLTASGQKGLKKGNYFLLLNDKKTISLNSFENKKINEIITFSITEKSIFTTDQKTKVAILDTAKNTISLYDIHNSREIKLTIPFDLKSKTILLNEGNLFVGGEMGKEMLVQYNIQNEKWYDLEIPAEVLLSGKAIDDLVVNDSLLIAIDNIIMPKYLLFYRLSSSDQLAFSHFKELKSNGAYESIYQGKITENYFGLISATYSGYVGSTEHITIYENIDLARSFAISVNEYDEKYHSFSDFVVVGDKVVIASREKGLGVFEIKNAYFKATDENGNHGFNAKVSASKIKYTDFKQETIVGLTILPNTEKIILTLKNKKESIRREIIDI